MAKANTTPAHTPGPWSDNGGFWVSDQNGAMVADCVTDQNKNLDSEEKHANARLIAAAPDLLERCEMSLHDAKDALSGDWVPTVEGWQAIIDDLAEVIANAKPK